MEPTTATNPNPQPVSGVTSPPVTPPPQAPVSPPVAKPVGNNFFLAFVTLLLGVGFGYGLVILLPNSPRPAPAAPQQTPKQGAITLPRDADRIQVCSENRGSLYVKPQDIPQGPIYMVYKGQVIGLEYMLAQDEYLAGKSFKYLKAMSMPVDHVNSGLVEKGHAGYAKPHYHIDLYTVSRAFEESIHCESEDNMNMENMPGMEAAPTATPSAAASPTSVPPTEGMKPMKM